MKFSYYKNLSPIKKNIYDISDSIWEVPIKSSLELQALSIKLKNALASDILKDTRRHTDKICRLICKDLGINEVLLSIKERRPSNKEGELLGLYELQDNKKPRITVWLKTAINFKTVSYKTFLRTVLHELGHHIDYHYFKFADSLHTKGFFIRESYLLEQIISPADINCTIENNINEKNVVQLELELRSYT